MIISLVKKLFPLVISSSLFLSPISAVAKEKQVRKSRPNFYIGGSVGIYQGTEDMQYLYGSMLRLRGNVSLDLSKNFRIESAVAYTTKERGPNVYSDVYNYGDIDVSIKSKINIAGFEALAYCLIPLHRSIFRIGGGLTLINLKENVSLSPLDSKSNTIVLEGIVRSVGPIFILGIDVPINKEKTMNAYIEFSRRFAKAEGIFEELEIGGSSLDMGLRSSLKF